jgi:plastocyanin
MRQTIAVSVVLAIVLLGGCGGGEQTVEPDLVAENTAFTPTELTATVGEELALDMANRDDFAHNFTIEELDIAQDLPVGANTLLGFTPEEAGTFDFLCTLHPQAMRGTLTISE